MLHLWDLLGLGLKALAFISRIVAGAESCVCCLMLTTLYSL